MAEITYRWPASRTIRPGLTVNEYHVSADGRSKRWTPAVGTADLPDWARGHESLGSTRINELRFALDATPHVEITLGGAQHQSFDDFSAAVIGRGSFTLETAGGLSIYIQFDSRDSTNPHSWAPVNLARGELVTFFNALPNAAGDAKADAVFTLRDFEIVGFAPKAYWGALKVKRMYLGDKEVTAAHWGPTKL